MIYCIYLLHTVLVVPPLAVISPLDLPHCLVDGRSVPPVFSAPGITMQSNPFVLLAKIKPCFYGASLYNTRRMVAFVISIGYNCTCCPVPTTPIFPPSHASCGRSCTKKKVEYISRWIFGNINILLSDTVFNHLWFIKFTWYYYICGSGSSITDPAVIPFFPTMI